MHISAASLRRVALALSACRRQLAGRSRADLDQAPATAATVLKRLRLLAARQELQRGSSILLLGDDDLLSIAIAAAFPTVHVAVADADALLLDTISASRFGHRIMARRADFRRNLPVSLTARFDVVVTDPPYTVAGQMVFLTRTMEALRHTGRRGVYLCASRMYLSPLALGRVASFARRSGLALRQIHENFNAYPAPPSVLADLRTSTTRARQFHSALLRFEASGVLRLPRLAERVVDAMYDYD